MVYQAWCIKSKLDISEKVKYITHWETLSVLYISYSVVDDQQNK